MNKILFLDLDGVLNVINGSYSTYMKTDLHFEKMLVNNLNNILKRIPDLNIVMSSSWRDDIEDTKEQLKEAGFLFNDRIISKTRDSDSNSFRYDEINDWLSNNSDDYDYLIIDDQINEEFYKKFNKKRIIKTDEKFGLTLELSYSILEHFNYKSKEANYLSFLIYVFEEGQFGYDIANDILKNSFKLMGFKKFNDMIDSDLSIERFHKNFRQLDMTDSSELDLIIWNALNLENDVFDIVEYILENKAKFKFMSNESIYFDFI